MKKILIGALLSFISLSTFAGYLSSEFQVGTTNQSLGGESGTGISFGLKGAFNIDRYSGIELGYQNYGEAKLSFGHGEFGETDQTLNSHSIDLGLKGMLPLRDGFSLNARIGLSYWRYESSVFEQWYVGRVSKFNDSGINVYYGISGQYAIYGNWDIGLLFQHIELSLAPITNIERMSFHGRSGDLSLNTFALTTGYKF